jgi:hypothetical protein
VTVITATVVQAYAAVRLAVSGVAVDGPLTITRTDANGVHDVRLAAGAVVSAGLLAAVDYEPALVGPVTYVADGASVTVDLGAQLAPRLSVVGRPAVARNAVELVAYSETSDAAPYIARVYMRQDELPITAPLSLRSGPLVLHLATYEEAKAVRDLAAAGQVLQLRQPSFPGLDLYLVPSRVSLNTVNESLTVPEWRVTIEYLETPWPVLPLSAGASWTYSDLVAQGGTYATLGATWPSYFDLAVGPVEGS